jgi:hypothetical protein
MPDEINTSFFLELKRPGEKPRPGQVKRIRRMRKMGYEVHVADTLEDAIEIVEERL